MKRAVFLDRDGVIIESVVRSGKPYPARSVEEIVLLTGVTEALHALKDAGFLLIVVTNQPDVGRGTLSIENVDAIHAQLLRELPLDVIHVCTHGADGECLGRKPLPGMLLDAAQKFDISLERSFMVGDRWRDIDAGHAAGCRTLFIDYGYTEELRAKPDYVISPTNAWQAITGIILSSNLIH